MLSYGVLFLPSLSSVIDVIILLGNNKVRLQTKYSIECAESEFSVPSAHDGDDVDFYLV